MSAARSLPEPVFTVSGAARLLGIPAATLRTWERRHGIGPSGRSPGGHRRYTSADLVRLRAMRTLVASGIPPGQAAGLATLSAGAGPAGPAAGSGPAGPAAGSGPAGPEAGRRRAAATVTSTIAPGTGPARAGPPMIPPSLLIQAALEMDAPLLYSMLGDAFAQYGVSASWQRLAVPALREFGRRNLQAPGQVAAEHMLSGCLLAALLHVIALAPPARSVRPVVLACAEEEQHVLPVYALHAELAGRGVDVRQLGSRVPRQALAHAVRAVQPAAVFVWAQVPATANPELFSALPLVPRIVIGGPGWQAARPHVPAWLVSSLDGAADLLTRCALAAS